MLGDWLKNVPESIKNELNEFGLAIGAISALNGSDEVTFVETKYFEVVGNKYTINALQKLGWIKGHGRVDNHKRLTSMYKHL